MICSAKNYALRACLHATTTTHTHRPGSWPSITLPAVRVDSSGEHRAQLGPTMRTIAHTLTRARQPHSVTGAGGENLIRPGRISPAETFAQDFLFLHLLSRRPAIRSDWLDSATMTGHGVGWCLRVRCVGRRSLAENCRQGGA